SAASWTAASSLSTGAFGGASERAVGKGGGAQPGTSAPCIEGRRGATGGQPPCAPRFAAAYPIPGQDEGGREPAQEQIHDVRVLTDRGCLCWAHRARSGEGRLMGESSRTKWMPPDIRRDVKTMHYCGMCQRDLKPG